MQPDMRSDNFDRGDNWDNNMSSTGTGTGTGAGQGTDNWDDNNNSSGGNQQFGGKPSMGDRLKGWYNSAPYYKLYS